MVARPQSGVCAETSLHGLVLLCQLREGRLSAARLKLAKVPALAKSLDERFSEALLTLFAAVGSRGWGRLCTSPQPPGLAPFPRFDHSLYGVAQNQFDLAFVIRSDRLDANYFAGRVLQEWFAEDLQLVVEYQLFHYLDNRNLFGFKCPPTLHGRHRARSCLVNAPNQPLWHQGSHLFLQHYVLDLDGWQELTSDQQQQIVGHEKLSGARLADSGGLGDTDDIDDKSHAGKTAVDDALPVVWQQLPSAGVREHGHVELLWSHSTAALSEFVRRRVEEDSDGFSDPLLEYQNNTLSCALFVPPHGWFESLNSS